MSKKIDYCVFVTMTDEQIQALSDSELAEAFTSAVILNQKANVSKEFRLYDLREQSAQMQEKLQSEIDRRNMEWVVPFYGRPYLATK